MYRGLIWESKTLSPQSPPEKSRKPPSARDLRNAPPGRIGRKPPTPTAEGQAFVMWAKGTQSPARDSFPQHSPPPHPEVLDEKQHPSVSFAGSVSAFLAVLGLRTQGTLATGTFTETDFVGPLAGMPLSYLREAISQGRAYVNVHTTQFPGGEIRGTIR